MRDLLALFNPVLGPKIIFRNRKLLWQLVKRNIQSRYRGSFLGFCWSFIQPLMMLCVYTFVFSIIFKARWGVDTGDSKIAFAVIMFAGMSVFNIFSEGVNGCCLVIAGHQNYVKKVVFPLEILPVMQVMSSFLLGLIWFALLVPGTLFVFGHISWTIMLLPLTLIPLGLVTLGIGWFVSSLGVYMRDIQHVVGIVIQVLFFMTPIFYPISAVPKDFQVLLRLNPLTMIIDETRNVFLFGKLPDWTSIGIMFLGSIVIAQLGFVWFCKTRKGFADVL